MKIDHNLHSASISNPYQKQLENQRIPKMKAQEDKVEISFQAKQLQRVNAEEPVRYEKVLALKQEIESGGYKIDPNLIARGMVRFYEKQ